jgi:hypothetical protein
VPATGASAPRDDPRIRARGDRRAGASWHQRHHKLTDALGDPNSATVDRHYGDATVTKLRAVVAQIDEELVQAPPSATLRAAWEELVSMLALGPAPQTRECPKGVLAPDRDGSMLVSRGWM